MPPKRTGSGTSAGAAKRTKTNDTGDNSSSSAPAAAPPSKRWSKVSGSRNVDASYKEITKDPAKAYSFICICRLPFGLDDDDDDDDDESSDEEEDAGADKSKKLAPCDGGKTCMCNKSAADHPEHKAVVSMAGFQKFMMQRIQADLRDPDLFEMYTFNDHAGYGVLEVVQNLLLDFAEEKNLKEQWAICEAMGMAFNDNGFITPMTMADDGEGINAACVLVGCMFITMIAKLERQKLLKPDSEFRNIGLVMGMYAKLANGMRNDLGLFEDKSGGEDDDDEEDEDEEGENANSKKAPSRKKMNPDRFESYIFAYAKKYNIDLRGPLDVDKLDVAEVGLPKVGADPWGWTACLKIYKDNHGRGKKIGGDHYDITAMSSAERKRSSHNGKDPLGRKEIEALKEGLVLQVG